MILQQRIKGMLTPEMTCAVSEYGNDIGVHICWWHRSIAVMVPRAALELPDNEFKAAWIDPAIEAMKQDDAA